MDLSPGATHKNYCQIKWLITALSCPELECLGGMQIRKTKKVLQFLRRKPWPSKMPFFQWQKFSHNTSEIFIHKRCCMLHITEQQPQLPAYRWGKWATSRLEKRITSIILCSYLGFIFTVCFLVELGQAKIKNSWRVQKILLKRRLKSRKSRGWAVTKVFWTVVLCFSHYDSHLLLCPSYLF